MGCVRISLGGDGGHAIYLHEDLQEGYTERCDTFDNAPLCKGHFKIQSLEVWGIQNSISFSHYFTHWRENIDRPLTSSYTKTLYFAPSDIHFVFVFIPLCLLWLYFPWTVGLC